MTPFPIADTLGLRSLGRVSDLVREAPAALCGDSSLDGYCARARAELA